VEYSNNQCMLPNGAASLAHGNHKSINFCFWDVVPF